MKQDQYLHILSYLHFTDNRNEPDRTDENFDRLWIRELSEMLNGTLSKFYNPSENLATDEVIVSSKARVRFKQYIQKKCKHFGFKIFKLCDSTGYTITWKYEGKDRQRTAQHLTATHATVTELTRKIEGCGHKLYMENLFSSPTLFDDLAKKQIYCCGTVRPNRRGMPQDLRPKSTKLKRGDIHVRTRAGLTAILWWDERHLHVD